MKLPGYAHLEEIHRGARSRVLRALRADGRSVILKTTPSHRPDATEVAAIHAEADLLGRVDHPRVVRLLDRHEHRGRPIMVIEDFGAEALSLRASRALDLQAALSIGISVGEGLAALHAVGMTHRDVNPSNILIASMGQVKLADLGLASLVSHEADIVEQPEHLEGTLRYLSPEQTGRVGRLVDARSDLYALGVTLYELIAGEPPFTGLDPLALMHAHLAQRPKPLSAHRADVPSVVSRLVARLLEKDPSRRYQTADGLVADLTECLRQLSGPGHIPDFPLGRADQPDRLSLPDRLYGRAALLDRLESAWERAASGQSGLVALAGHAGAGKSALADAFEARLAPRPGFFVRGKYDPYNRSQPFGAFRDAFADLIRKLASQPEAELKIWRRRLEAGLQGEGAVLADLVPGLETLLGPQPAVRPLMGHEGEARLFGRLQALVRAIAQPGAPLVILGDDLQWIDSGSYRLVGRLLAEEPTPHLLILCAWRTEEVGPDHMLTSAIQSLERAGVSVGVHDVHPLSEADASALVADTLLLPVDEVGEIAAALHHKTLGNPLHLRRLLVELAERGILERDTTHRRWSWDLARLQGHPLADNVVDLLCRQLQGLTERARGLLGLAACMGHQFDLRLLAALDEDTTAGCALALLPAVRRGFLTVRGDFGRLTADEETRPYPCRFAHDRIHQAALSLVPEANRTGLRLRIGRTLHTRLTPEALEASLFEVAGHYAVALDRLSEAAERRQVRGLLIRAGDRALAASAFDDAALWYERAGHLSVAEDKATSDAFELGCRRMEAMAGAARPLDHLRAAYEAVVAQAGDAPARGRAAAIWVAELGVRGGTQEAIEVGLWALSELGWEVSEPVSHEELARLRVALLDACPDAVEGFTTIGAASDPALAVSLLLIRGLGNPLWSSGRNDLLSRLVLQASHRSLTQGLVASSGLMLAATCIPVAHMLGDGSGGRALALAGVQIAERLQAEVGAARHLCASYTGWLTSPLKAVLPEQERAFIEAAQVGDTALAGDAAMALISSYWQAGLPLSELMARARPMIAQMARTGFHDAKISVLLDVATQALSEVSEAPGPSLDAVIAHAEAGSPEVSADALDLGRLIGAKVHLLYGRADQAYALAHAATFDSTGTVRELERCLLRALSAVSIEADGPPQATTLRGAFETARAELVRLNGMEEGHCSRHLLALVEAEAARLSGALVEAELAYDRSVILARQIEAWPDAALAACRAAEFHLRRGLESIAGAYLREARYLLTLWGAPGVIASLIDRYGALAEDWSSTHHAISGGSTSLTLPRRSERTDTAQLDLATVVKASQAISAEVRLDVLLYTLLGIVMESAGAQRGFLILAGDAGWMVEAGVEVGETGLVRLPAEPFDASRRISQGIVRYVVRSGEDVVIEDAQGPSDWRLDTHLQRSTVRSVLCASITRQGQPAGAVYLEHNQAPGVFTRARAHLVRLLASQAAISIDNARLYDRLSQRNAEITAFKDRLARENEYLREEVRSARASGDIIGQSPVMRRLLEQVAVVAPTDATVLLLGESGTGKELIAHAVHDASQRRDKPLVVVNCATVPDNLFESEFFGHVRGAFTGAQRDREGRFQLADQGTLFLDEVGEIPLELQSKLLRVLQEGTFERVGETRTRTVDVRIVAATNKDLKAMVQAGTFREDLYYRLGVFPLHVAPLRARVGDVPMLAAHFLRRSAQRMRVPVPELSAQHLEQLNQYDWPGNVRELKNVVERAVITARVRGLQFDVQLAQPEASLPEARPAEGRFDEGAQGVLSYAELKDLERRNAQRALEQASGRIAGRGGAAERLGVRPTTLRSRLKAMGILP